MRRSGHSMSTPAGLIRNRCICCETGMDVAGTVLAALAFVMMLFVVMPVVADQTVVHLFDLLDVAELDPEWEAQQQMTQDALRLGLTVSVSILVSAAVYRCWSWIVTLLI